MFVTLYVQKYPFIQVIFFLHASEVVIFVLINRPYFWPIRNRLEVFNETCVLLVACLYLTFQGLAITYETRKVVGDILIASVSIQILVNLIFFFIDLFIFLKRKQRTIWAKRMQDRRIGAIEK